MAHINQLISFISKWEGGYVNDPSDAGGPTNKGVTLTTWKNKGYDKDEDGDIDINDLKLITHEDMIEVILRPHYWDLWKADHIKNQSIANLVVDWTWCSGTAAIKSVQRILGIKVDGIVGNITLNALNNYRNQAKLFTLIKNDRIRYIMTICDNKPTLKRFQKGWLNRIAGLNFTSILVITMLTLLMPACRAMAAHSDRTVVVSKHEVVSGQAVADQATALASNTLQLTTNTNLVSTIDSQVIASVTKQPRIKNNGLPLVVILLILCCIFVIAYLLSNYLREKSN